jgi:hypothetical protein
MSVLAAPPTTQPFAVEFGRPATVGVIQEGAPGLQLKIPLLAGERREKIFPWPGARREEAGLPVLQSGDTLIGWAAVPVKNDRTLQAQTQTLYRRVLAATTGRHLYRVWNYVPRINALIDGFENYRAFCQGRSLAFEEALGGSFSRVLSSASAVGVEDDFLSLIFVAGSASPRHMENPEQVPAYRYPAEHGPRSPSFSRATVVRTGERTFTFLSGTSAIKGHVTVAPGTLLQQIDCTLDNLRLISREAGAGDHLGAAYCRERHFKIYLRHAADLAVTRTRLERELLRPGDVVTYLRADICRAALQIEIEATLVS